MNHNSNLQTSRFICLLIAIAVACCSLASKADDAATATAPEITNTPAPAVTPETTPAPETTNAPAPAVVPETTPVPEATNTPATAVAPAITNTPAIVVAPETTNQPAAAPVPLATSKPVTTPTPGAKKTPLYQPFTLGAEAGTTGYGGTAGWRFADHFGVVGGADFFNYSLNQTINDIPYNANLHMMSEYAGLNLYPWRNRSFHFSLGAYFNQNRLSGSAVSDGTLEINGATVPAGDTVRLVYKQQPVDPYVSLGGNFYFDKARHFSLGAEIGAFYLGNPRVHISDSQGVVPPADLDANQQKLAHDLKKIPVWPIIKLSICYSF